MRAIAGLMALATLVSAGPARAALLDLLYHSPADDGARGPLLHGLTLTEAGASRVNLWFDPVPLGGVYGIQALGRGLDGLFADDFTCDAGLDYCLFASHPDGRFGVIGQNLTAQPYSVPLRLGTLMLRSEGDGGSLEITYMSIADSRFIELNYPGHPLPPAPPLDAEPLPLPPSLAPSLPDSRVRALQATQGIAEPSATLLVGLGLTAQLVLRRRRR